jgi:bifunctional non-homologous end joining protein LigD
VVAFQRKNPAAIGIKAPFPGFIEPALATSINKLPSGDRWLHEVKFDGYRFQTHLANEESSFGICDWTKVKNRQPPHFHGCGSFWTGSHSTIKPKC